jgi:uncharacterized membrane protein YeaQ/YmgE (transglycosylase-associated protein family)
MINPVSAGFAPGTAPAMSIIAYIILLVLTGLVVGALGRLLLPGRDPMSIMQTILLGIAGSFIAGLIVWAISGEPRSGGLLLSVLVSAGLVYAVRRMRGGSLTRPAPRRRTGAGDRPGLFGR